MRVVNLGQTRCRLTGGRRSLGPVPAEWSEIEPFVALSGDDARLKAGVPRVPAWPD